MSTPILYNNTTIYYANRLLGLVSSRILSNVQIILPFCPPFGCLFSVQRLWRWFFQNVRYVSSFLSFFFFPAPPVDGFSYPFARHFSSKIFKFAIFFTNSGQPKSQLQYMVGVVHHILVKDCRSATGAGQCSSNGTELSWGLSYYRFAPINKVTINHHSKAIYPYLHNKDCPLASEVACGSGARARR